MSSIVAVLARVLPLPSFSLDYPAGAAFWSPILSRTDVYLAVVFAVVLYTLRALLTRLLFRPFARAWGLRKVAFQEKLVHSSRARAGRSAMLTSKTDREPVVCLLLPQHGGVGFAHPLGPPHVPMDVDGGE